MAENNLTDKATESTLVTLLQDEMDKFPKFIKPSIDKYLEILGEYANGWYADVQGTRRPLNMVARSINLLLPLLASRNPKAMVRSRIIQLTPYAETLRLTLNHLTEKIKLGETLKDVVLIALCYMGVVKTGISPGGPKIKDAYGVLHDSGQLFCDVIYPEDYFFDITARRREEVDFEGNYFYVPYSYILDSGLYQNYDKLAEAYDKIENKNSSRGIIEDGRGNLIEPIKPYAKLAEVWIPSENILLTMPPSGQGTKPLRVVDYNGPVSGPYDTLCFSRFPESVIPIAPLFINLDLHYFINIMVRKMARQANREKKLLLYEGNNADDVDGLTDAPDGATRKVANIEGMKEVEFGGTADASYKWVEWLIGQWSEMGRNQRLLEGSKAPSPTLGQEQMLQANASISIDEMIDNVHTLIKNIYHKMAYYIFTDPLMDITVSKRIRGLENIPVKVTADTREGDFWDYNFDVEPYSQIRMNPALRRRYITEVATGIMIPTMGLAAQQGAMLDVPELVKIICRDMDLTEGEIDSIYKTITSGTKGVGPYPMLPPKLPVSPNDSLGASESSRELNSIRQQGSQGSGSSYPNRPYNPNRM